MRGRLQYLYMLSVFTGALFTAYLLMHEHVYNPIPQRDFTAIVPLRAEAQILAPGVLRLMETGEALKLIPKESPTVPRQLSHRPKNH